MRKAKATYGMNVLDSSLRSSGGDSGGPHVLVVDDLPEERVLMVKGALEYLMDRWRIPADDARRLVSWQEGKEPDDLYEWVNQHPDGRVIIDLRLGQWIDVADFDEDIRADNRQNKIVFASGSDSPEMWWPFLCRDLSGRGLVVKYGNEEPFARLPGRVKSALEDVDERRFHVCGIVAARLQKLADATPPWVVRLLEKKGWEELLGRRRDPGDRVHAAKRVRLALELEVLWQEQQIAQRLRGERLTAIRTCAEHWERYEYLAKKLDDLAEDKNLESQVLSLKGVYGQFQLEPAVRSVLETLGSANTWALKHQGNVARESWQEWLKAARDGSAIDDKSYENARKYCVEFSKSFSDYRRVQYKSLEFGGGTGRDKFRDYWEKLLPLCRVDHVLRARQIITAWEKASVPPDEAEWATGAPPTQWSS